MSADSEFVLVNVPYYSGTHEQAVYLQIHLGRSCQTGEYWLPISAAIARAQQRYVTQVYPGRYQAGTSHHDIHHTTRRLAALSPATTASDPRKSLVPLNYVQLRSRQRSAVRRSYTDDKSVACSRRGRGHHGLMKTPRKANDRLSSLPPVRANTRGLRPAAPRPARHAAERCTPSRSAPILNA